ncbi:MAG: nucleoside-diphosphate sugar epimerase/dehydratase [Candidatus Bipolaricaulis sp.]|nr:nucleoside-diphosphate sugar epimerase/dehydratase [Candidatus Bipolaricaulis sp.]
MTLRALDGLWIRRTGVVLLDAAIVSASLVLAFWLRFDGAIPAAFVPILVACIPVTVITKMIVFVALRVDRLSWKHVGVDELVLVFIACAAGSTVFALAALALRELGVFGAFPRSVLGIDFPISFLAVGGVRLSRRLIDRIAHRSSRRGAASERRAVIVGAGDAGAQLVRALQEDADRPYRIVGFLDDNPRKVGAVVHGVPVLGPRSELSTVLRKHGVTTILIAMPSASGTAIRDTVSEARRLGIEDIQIVPGLPELYTGRVTGAELRRLEPTDVLQREEVLIGAEPIQSFLGGRSVLVTGAAGSIGSELCRQVLRFGASHLAAVDFDETGLFDLENELRRRFPNASFDVAMGDVRDERQMRALLARCSPDVVYHAAAYKHVPMMEAFPAEAIKTNVLGTRNVLEAARAAECAAFVLISTDKAVNPSSVMGASKRVAEMLVREGSGGATRCLAVRFGNVLGSRGSVLQTFQHQVENRRPVTVTHPDMERYFMVTAEAVQLVLQASAVGEAGQVLVLDMGKPVRIVDLARDVIRFYGLEPDVDVPIVFSGIRPGEKLFEELLSAEDGTEATEHARLLVARLQEPSSGWNRELDELVHAATAGDDDGVIERLKRLVPTYRAVPADG